MNGNEREALRWYLQGAKDSKTAERNAAAGDFEVSCFLFHQAAEKILKAYLCLQGARSLFGHSTARLASRCAEHEGRFVQLAQACSFLDLFYVPTRYPFALPEGTPYEHFTLEHAQAAMDHFQEVYRAVYDFFKDLTDHISREG
ncbi:MAG: HEPN domain-containing protein [Spirochaetales bacterium]|nr:HEPN domain-containing protein [Spirochaetales bacterium]